MAKQTWGSSGWGASMTGALPWTLALDGEQLSLQVSGRTTSALITALDQITVTPGYFWSGVNVNWPGLSLCLDGIPNGDAQRMMAALGSALNAYKKRRNALVAKCIASLDRDIVLLVKWGASFRKEAENELRHHGWLTDRFCERLQASKPRNELGSVLDEPAIQKALTDFPVETCESVRKWATDMHALAHSINEDFLQAELKSSKTFFDRVEKSPLTDEQASAVICLADRVQVIAAAGSGKTSTMIAKAGYVLRRKFVPADKILMLAFNKSAATELQARVRDRLGPLGFDANAITAATFHKLGLDIIGEATGRRPMVAPWVENGQELEHVDRLVATLKERDTTFRMQWDLFRTVFGRDLPTLEDEEREPEDWDADRKQGGFRTLRGEIVKSHGERLIANWLFFNGVDYRYEQPYAIDTADSHHRQYLPDFFYPEIGAYHEHWALDATGNPPPSFHGYLDGVQWKRQLHSQHGSTLLETTTAQLWSGEAFRYLERELTARGVRLDPDPDREVVGRATIEHRELMQLMHTLIVHAKSNQLDDAALRSRLHSGPAIRFRFRHELFLPLFNRVRAAWDESLKEIGAIDFEDMLVHAADHVELGEWRSPYELVMADEFQDASRAQGRLLRGLVARAGQRLFAVGDDWQSINRFAGADINVMTQFEEYFGRAEVYRLQQTFRCPQTLCDLSGRFVQRNPQQLRKAVRSDAQEFPPTLRVYQVSDEQEIGDMTRRLLKALHREATNGNVPLGRDGKVSVAVLGRYKDDKRYLVDTGEFSSILDVRFSTVHGFKGLEADYIILPRVASGYHGFPSRQKDDSLLLLMMPEGEDFPDAEERRLFYVALTRARRAVRIVAEENRFSRFVVELMNDWGITPIDSAGAATRTAVCPTCHKGTVIVRRGRFGSFLGCTRFPACLHRAAIAARH